MTKASQTGSAAVQSDETAVDAAAHLELVLSKLRSKRITYFPIRHHSPVCAAHIEKWILTHRPSAVLVEGPSSFTERIHLLTDPDCIAPVAMYTSFVDKKGRLLPKPEKENEASDGPEKSADPSSESKQSSEQSSDSSSDSKPSSRETSASSESESDSPQDPLHEKENDNDKDPGPDANASGSAGGSPASKDLDFTPRFAAYYPFCDYSPELVALRTGKQVGAYLRFIDLEYGEMVLAEYQARTERQVEPVRVESLTEDAHLRHSKYLKELARRMGCRDFNELWDHLFECTWETLDTDAFIDRLTAYCVMARLEYSEQDLLNDGTIAREACMAAAICEELEETDGPILVVTGGFHTVALPALVEANTKRPEEADFANDELGVWLIRYSFDQLDSLAGYSAGMPSPAYYDKLWTAAKSQDGDKSLASRFQHIAADALVEISRKTRELKLPNQITTPDSIAAMQMTKQLAALRGHPWPQREDILDGVRSCFIKGELSVEGQLLIRLVQELLAGNRIGQVPSSADLPPIFADFNAEIKRFRINLYQVERKEHSLDLYRSEKHREMSRFFHRLGMLDIPYASLRAGPDFVHGRQLDLIQERWETNWSPLVESKLLEAAILGTTVEEAASNKLLQQIAALELEAKGRSTKAVVSLLVRACRLGLHARCLALIPLIDRHIAEDPSFSSVVFGLSQLELLYHAREPLAAQGLTAIPQLMQIAYQRACRLLHDLPRCPDEEIDANINAMKVLREVLVASDDDDNKTPETKLDSALFYHALQMNLQAPFHESQACIVGAAAGILYAEGKLSSDQLIDLVCGYIGASVQDPAKSAAILRGLLSTACEIAWQLNDLIQAFDRQFQGWDDKTFMEQLPELRLAFSLLSPRDIARVADQVSSFYGGESLGELLHMDLDEETLQFGLQLDNKVKEVLKADGLRR